MTLRIDQIKFETDLPDLPSRAPAVRVEAPDLERRRPGMRKLAEHLALEEGKAVETEFGLAMVAKAGEVEFFHASGAVWCANHALAEAGENELRRWEGLERVEDAAGEPFFTLGRRARDSVLDLAREMAEAGGFDLELARKPELSMVQVAQLSQEGETLQEGAGEATITYGYEMEGLPVLGAGAKTMIDFEPARGGRPVPSGALSVWRSPVGTETVELGGTEAILAAGLLEDPDLNLAAERGGRIVIEQMEFGLMALPAMMRQGFVFPVLRIDARVELREERQRYHVGRFCPAATARAFARAGLYADYLGGVR